MIEITIVGSDPTSDSAYDSDNPTANQEKFAYDLRRNLYALAGQSVQMQFPQTSDFSSIDTALDGLFADVSDWFDDLPSAPAEGGSRGLPAPADVPSFPDIISSVISLAVAGAAGGVPVLIIRIVMEVGFRLLAGWLEGRVFSGSTPDYAEMFDMISEQLEALNEKFVAPDAGDNSLTITDWLQIAFAETYENEGEVSNQSLLSRLIEEGKIIVRMPSGEEIEWKGIAPILSQYWEPN